METRRDKVIKSTFRLVIGICQVCGNIRGKGNIGKHGSPVTNPYAVSLRGLFR